MAREMASDNEKQETQERRIFLALGVIASVTAVLLIIFTLSAFHASYEPATSKGKRAGHEMFRSSLP